MDINGFNLDQEYFGFGGYRQYAKSNTSFMNFSFEETDEFKAVQKKHEDNLKEIRGKYFPKADALPYDEKGNMERNLIYAQAEAEILKENDRYDKEVKNLKVKLGIAKGTTGLQTVNQLLQNLGIGTGSKSTPPVIQTNAKSSGSNAPAPSNNKKVILIVGGVVVASILGFVIYKMAKK